MKFGDVAGGARANLVDSRAHPGADPRSVAPDEPGPTGAADETPIKKDL
ncbi:hypothetical protein GCM10022262_30200 [Georgenia daeguensis]|uniref:Uncharacterized protein n=1 Tax=Georgenia daeguensis TaxID=908355 RepID=A0ABP8EXD1_9MICO